MRAAIGAPILSSRLAHGAPATQGAPNMTTTPATLAPALDTLSPKRRDGGWRVSTPGRWIVGGTDGFSRKGEVCWDVESVPIGDETWFIAS